MIYQLPTGRCIHITVEQYLDMTDADIDYMVRTNSGDYISSPFHASVIKKTKKREESDDVNSDIDYEPEYDEKQSSGSDADSCIEEELPEIPS